MFLLVLSCEPSQHTYLLTTVDVIWRELYREDYRLLSENTDFDQVVITVVEGGGGVNARLRISPTQGLHHPL